MCGVRANFNWKKPWKVRCTANLVVCFKAKRRYSMKHESTDTIVVSLLKEAVESEGCHLSEVDLENHVIKVNGPDDVVSHCARAVAEILD